MLMSDSERSIDRRTLCAAAGAGALGLLLRSGGAQAAPWGEAEAANVQLVYSFCQAWSTLDLRRVVAHMADDTVYRMSETTPPVTGHQALIDQMQPWVDTSKAITFRILETFAAGPLVVNHRIDTFASDTRPLTWEGVGVFFVQNGAIKEWFDYTIRVDRG
jgi:limonene-1,2-epoxide hydrolase